MDHLSLRLPHKGVRKAKLKCSNALKVLEWFTVKFNVYAAGKWEGEIGMF